MNTVVIGYLYNNNGMATWCIEAAKALASKDYNVILVKHKSIELLDLQVTNITIVDYEYPNNSNKSIIQKIFNKLKNNFYLIPFYHPTDSFLQNLTIQLSSMGINSVDAFLLNQSNLFNKFISVKQYIVAWANPPYLINYLKNAITTSISFNQKVNALLQAIYWYKSDIFSYQNASGVFAVSEKLTQNIQQLTTNSIYTVYPGVFNSFNINPITPMNNKVKIVMMALHVEEKRKRLVWVIEQIKKIKTCYSLIEITLIGEYTNLYKSTLEQLNMPIKFLGKLDRKDALNELAKNDLMIFASSVDDWGYVQIEAMSRGLAVLAPNSSPFDEIVGDNDYLFSVTNDIDFINKFNHIILNPSKLQNDKKVFFDRYQYKFSGDIFGTQLSSIINHQSN